MAIGDAIVYAVTAVPAIGIAWYLHEKKNRPEKRAAVFGEWFVLGAGIHHGCDNAHLLLIKSSDGELGGTISRMASLRHGYCLHSDHSTFILHLNTMEAGS